MTEVDAEAIGKAFADDLREILGDRLSSVVLYGSVARGEAIPGVSDINLLVLLEEMTQPLLLSIAPLVRDWVDHGNGVPLFLSRLEWERSVDTMAVEASDMHAARRVLLGPDPLVNHDVLDADLRLQTELELRQLVVGLRRGLILSGDDSDEIGRRIHEVLPSLLTYMRATLRLSGGDAPRSTPEVVKRVAELVEAPEAGRALTALWNSRVAGEEDALGATDPELGAVLGFLEKLVHILDSHPAQTVAHRA